MVEQQFPLDVGLSWTSVILGYYRTQIYGQCSFEVSECIFGSIKKVALSGLRVTHVKVASEIKVSSI